MVANRYANCTKETQGLSIRVTHWRTSLRGGKRIECVYDSHRGMSRGAPCILIAPPSIADPISSEAAAPYADWLARWHARGSTVTSVCCGAFLLAEAKLLDGRTVTTHWYYVDAFKERYPAVIVDADKLVIDDGDIITAGGMTAWTDLGTRLIRRLLGPTVMSETARFMLVDPSGREQSYYSSFSPRLHHSHPEILTQHHSFQTSRSSNVDLTKMAKKAGLKMHTFMRRFTQATNLKPTEYCQRLRIGKAREMLESTNHSVERISWAVGYEDPTSFRRIFHRIIGLCPSGYRSRLAVNVSYRESF